MFWQEEGLSSGGRGIFKQFDSAEFVKVSLYKYFVAGIVWHQGNTTGIVQN